MSIDFRDKVDIDELATIAKSMSSYSVEAEAELDWVEKQIGSKWVKTMVVGNSVKSFWREAPEMEGWQDF